MSNDYRMPVEGTIPLKDVLKVIQISPATWYKGRKDGIFPMPVPVGKRGRQYNVNDIRLIINNRECRN